MAESLGGSRGRNDNAGKTNVFAAAKTQGPARTGGGAGGGLLDRPAPIRRTGGMAAALGGGGFAAPRARPSSAPRERPRGGGGGGGGPGGGGGGGGGNMDKALAARARVEELRQVKEAQYWGREDKDALRANRRDLPAFWSISAHGQPYHDERLAAGATNFYRLSTPAGLAGPGDGVAAAVGPATLQQAALRKSLETGMRYFASLSDLAPLPPGAPATQRLGDADREFLLGRLTPFQRIHALHQGLDKDPGSACVEWLPWPLAILNRETLVAEREGRRAPPPKYDIADWNGGPAQRDMLMRLATAELEYLMRRHLKFMSERQCSAARAPAALEKDILRQAFWRVDPGRSGAVSVQQFLQVWQNLLRLMEYEDVWVKGKDFKGRTRHQQVLKPKRTLLLDRNMAAALFVKYGFDKDGLMPYIVFINALCETPARLLGHEVLLAKDVRGKNGLEDEQDIAMCMGNAKIEYRYCKSGVFPPGEFSAKMGKRSFKPPKAHMWLEHVYGYAGMLEYTLQSNIFYTHNTGQPLNPHTAKAVAKTLLAAQGAQEGTQLRPEQLKRTEFVYYTGSVGVVFDKEKYDAGLPCQRFFFGHNNDIQCLAMHPNRKWVATGQQKATGEREVPYVCVWDVDHCMQLQRLDHERDERGVIALGFSGDGMAGTGGELLLTVTSDDRHSIHVWRWLPASNKYVNAHYIPGWSLGPEKKIHPLRGMQEMYFNNSPYSIMDGEALDDQWLGRFPFDLDNWQAACGGSKQGRTGHGNEYEAVQTILRASRQPLQLDAPAWEASGEWWEDAAGGGELPAPTPGSERGPCPLWSHLEHPDLRVRAEDADGFYMAMRPVKREEGFFQPGADEDKRRFPYHEQVVTGCNGTPPMVYGVVWNPLKPHDGRKGSEFASYGVKHLKVWIANDEGRFVGTMASFGTSHIENVLSALYVPAMHAMRSPGDSCLLTGFASGKLGLWVPPYPTRVGATYSLVRHFDAHAPGRTIALNDGTQVHGGVRALKMRRTSEGTLEVLSGGADGCVRCWTLQEVAGARPDGTPVKGVKLGRTDKTFQLQPPGAGLVRPEEPPLVVALDCHPQLDREFLAGTNGCDIWEVDADPRVIVEGHEDDLDEVAAHSECPHTFATACRSGKCRVWDARRRDVVMSADLGYPLCGVAFSQEPLAVRDEAGRVIYSGFHLAVSGERGQLTVMRCDTLQPLVHRHDVASKQAIPELKYSPHGGPRMLAAAAADLTIYLYRADRNYQLTAKCLGHSGTVTHVDWSLPVSLPGTPLQGRFVLQSCDTAAELLYWNPQTGKKLPYNLRDAEWHTWTLPVGFDVMGVWPDGSDGTDVNSVDRCRLGAPIYDPLEAAYEGSRDAAMHYSEQDSADGVSGAGFLVTADDFSTVKLFNYPVVADDAPYKAFRGHASHVTAVRFLADDQLVVSVGGHDRGIYQWRTCGVASGLPPLPVIYSLLAGCDSQAGGDPDKAKSLRGALWGRLKSRARAFRSYERLKLLAMRTAVEEKRINSAATAVPQPKLPEQMVWAKLPGNANQYGPVPRSKLGAESAEGLEGKQGVRGSVGAAGGGVAAWQAAAAAKQPTWSSSSPAGTPRSPSVGPAGGGGAAAAAQAAAQPSPRPPQPPAAVAAVAATPSASRSPSIIPGTGGSAAPTAASKVKAPSPPASSNGFDSYSYSGEVGSYEPSLRPSPATPPAPTTSAATPPPPPPASSSRPASRPASAAPSVRGVSGGGTPPPSTPGTEGSSGSVVGRRGVEGAAGGRSGKRYVTDSMEDEVPDEVPEEEDF
ncbi:hypothetical protein Agub_g12921 [Astrephomene gubernaculifera]|uniref:EML-like second beta-propeller domain-containing protein n=1 Tax=Astrephomene gubernaculifera TaxID=47775 RepID=A0AAD3DZ29_9CHLO|nr:hypothetical protein Agub_g12921 [Astrephomene gubernaculifera]